MAENKKPSQMTVTEIVAEYLRQHGFEGLCNGDCGCGVDALAPCSFENCFGNCMPARKANCEECNKADCAFPYEMDGMPCYRPIEDSEGKGQNFIACKIEDEEALKKAFGLDEKNEVKNG